MPGVTEPLVKSQHLLRGQYFGGAGRDGTGRAERGAGAALLSSQGPGRAGFSSD